MFRLFLYAVLAGLALSTAPAYATLPTGQTPPAVELSGEAGGKVAGGPWQSSSLKGKAFIIFYVDPDEADLNNHVSEAIKAQSFPAEKFASIAIINMKASWKPNFAINSRLEEKQRQYPRTTYVRDMDALLVKKWSMTDDSNNVLLVNPAGKVVFSVDGKLSQKHLDELLAKIEREVKGAHHRR